MHAIAKTFVQHNPVLVIICVAYARRASLSCMHGTSEVAFRLSILTLVTLSLYHTADTIRHLENNSLSLSLSYPIYENGQLRILILQGNDPCLSRQQQMLYQIENTEFHGKAMVATQDIQPGPEGFTILKENAILRMPTAGTNGDMSGTPPSILDKFDPQIWTDWYIFQQQPPEVKSKILDMYHEMDCRHAVWLRNYLDNKKQELQQQQGKEHRRRAEGKNDDNDDEEKKLDSSDPCDEEFSSSILDHVDEFTLPTSIGRGRSPPATTRSRSESSIATPRSPAMRKSAGLAPSARPRWCATASRRSSTSSRSGRRASSLRPDAGPGNDHKQTDARSKQ